MSAARMSMTIYVPLDSAAVAVGADEVVQALQRAADQCDVDLSVVRQGSRGMCWLEPLAEVVTPAGRVGFGPMRPSDAQAVLMAAKNGLEHGEMPQHPLSVGLVDQLPYLARQQRVLFERCGVIDPLSLQAYQQHGGGAALRKVLQGQSDVLGELGKSGLRGRGGAAFPAAIKWQTVAQADAGTTGQKYVVCNADEGDSGTFADRMLMEGDPFLLIEGMTLAGLAVGATQGYVYVRSEYPIAVQVLRDAVAVARDAGWLGPDVLGSGKAFDLDIRMGAGSYVCGEETAMLESLEGKRGVVRAKPPLPALSGLFGQPTVINNVLTFASVPAIVTRGGAWYQDLGMGRSTGTLPFQLAGNIRYGGLVELPFGVTLRTLLEAFGGGTASGRPIKAVQVGGPLGTYLPDEQWDTPLDYEAYAAMGATVGHGGIVVHDDRADLSRLARYAMHFCAVESCGKCTPCRIGSTRGVEVIDRLVSAKGDQSQQQAQHALLLDLCETMTHGSLCAMGGMTPNPVLSALNYWPQDFGLGAEDRTAVADPSTAT